MGLQHRISVNFEGVGNGIYTVGDTTFEFPSSRDPSVKYIVSVSPVGTWCTCPGWQYRKECKHVRAVESDEHS